MLIERVSIGLDLDPLSTAGNYREHSSSCRDDPHVVLQLRQVFFGRRTANAAQALEPLISTMRAAWMRGFGGWDRQIR